LRSSPLAHGRSAGALTDALSSVTIPAAQSPEILDAVVAANSGLEHAYGDDRWSRRLDQVFANFSAPKCASFPVATGTAANSAGGSPRSRPPMERSLRTRKRTWCAMNARARALLRWRAGFITIAGAQGKLTVEGLTRALESNPPSVHSVQPAALTLTQASEFGTVYGSAEIAATGRRRPRPPPRRAYGRGPLCKTRSVTLGLPPQ